MGKKMNKRKTSFMKLIQFFLYWFDGQFAGGDYVIYKLICSIICVQFILSSSNCCEFCRHCFCPFIMHILKMFLIEFIYKLLGRNLFYSSTHHTVRPMMKFVKNRTLFTLLRKVVKSAKCARPFLAPKQYEMSQLQFNSFSVSTAEFNLD